jgi:hypothetical protein
MNVEIETETPIFLFWEYLFRNFSILSLQCVVRWTEKSYRTVTEFKYPDQAACNLRATQSSWSEKCVCVSLLANEKFRRF